MHDTIFYISKFVRKICKSNLLVTFTALTDIEINDNKLCCRNVIKPGHNYKYYIL